MKQIVHVTILFQSWDGCASLPSNYGRLYDKKVKKEAEHFCGAIMCI